MTTRKAGIAGFILVVGLGAGLLLGYFVIPKAAVSRGKEAKLVKPATIAPGGAKDALRASMVDVKKDPARAQAIQTLLQAVDTKEIEKHLKFLASEPHVAGTEREENVLANYVKDKFTEYGLDTVKLASYQVLLSYPDVNNPNTVQVLNISTGEVFLNATSQEDIIEGMNSNIGPAFLAYSPPGSATGNLVYVNYGTNEDFDTLQRLGVNLVGVICLTRYGKGFRGQKVRNCASRGGVGSLLYLDPEQVAPEGLDNVFPNSTWMPDTAMQRGSLMAVGDPLTPGVPATASTERIDPAFAGLPPIPCHTIGYRDAKALLDMLGGPEAPPEFQGGFNMTYRVGPFSDERPDKVIQLRVNNLFSITTVNNVIGTIKGSDEPDRYVITGNHRDSWGYGAVSPSSGTATLLELARVLGHMKQKGVRPKRTVMICSWAAAEYGLIGSTEWVEEHLLELQSRAVSYIDVDQCASGSVFAPTASPVFAPVVVRAAKLVKNAMEPSRTLYDTWMEYVNSGSNVTAAPEPMSTHGASDNAPFNFYAGIPSVGIGFVPDWKKYGTMEYPAYHTAYDNLHLYRDLIDPDMALAKMCAQLNGVTLFLLSDAPLLPMNFQKLSDRLSKSLQYLEDQQFAYQMEVNGISLDPLRFQIEAFQNASDAWQTYVTSLKTIKPALMRLLNDKMTSVEKAFLKATGLPGRPLVRHLAFAPSEFDRYSVRGFPVFSDLLYYINRLPPQSQPQGWKNLRFYLSDLILAIKLAARALRLP